MDAETEKLDDAEDPRVVRKRRGCRNLFIFLIALVLVLLLVAIGGYFYSGTSSFAGYLKRKIEANLEAKLDRNVEIGKVTIEKGRISRVVLEDVRIENAEGASHPWFLIAPRVVIEGGVESFRSRTISVDSVLIQNPEIFIEIFPEGGELAHNFPSWKRSAPRNYEITRLEVGEISVDEGHVLYEDRGRDLRFDLRGVDSRVTADIRSGAIDGVVVAKQATVAAPSLQPIELSVTTGFEFADGALTIRRLRARGEGLEARMAGSIDPVVEAVYRFQIEVDADLNEIERITGAGADLEGDVAFKGELSGSAGTFELRGALESEEIVANSYTLRDVESTLTLLSDEARLEIARAGYAEGTVSGVWTMSSMAAPQPMNVVLDLDRVVLESILADWNIDSSGLRGRTSGTINYRWEGPDLLQGSGGGNLRIAPGSVAFSDAPYPLPVSGNIDLKLHSGVVSFSRSRLETPKSTIVFSGDLELENLISDLAINVESRDFSELDRLGVNFARSAGNNEATLLGLGGSGTIRGDVTGPLSAVNLAVSITGQDLRYNDSPLGRGEMKLNWNGGAEKLTFVESTFRRGDSVLALGGDIRFPDNGPVFNLMIDATRWDLAEALDLVDLEFDATGAATGRLAVRGTPDKGTVELDQLRIEKESRSLVASGAVSWLPNETVALNLNLDADEWDVAETIAILGLELNASGLATGKLRVEGTTEQGTVRFNDVIVRQNGSRLALNGDVGWLPEEGGVDLKLTIGSESVPLQTVIAFLDLGDIPVEGDLSGSLTIEGPKDDLSGAGSIIVRNGKIADEPIDLLTADLSFVNQRLEVDHLKIEAPAGTIEGEATWSFADETFSYVIEPTLLDLSLVKSLEAFSGIVDGTVRLSSSGAGTLESPEFVLEATLENGTINGIEIPAGQARPAAYVAVRNSELIIRAAALDALDIDGQGVISEAGELDGRIRINITDVATLASVLMPGSALPISGNLVADLDLGGSLGSIGEIEVDGSLTEMNVIVSGEIVSTNGPVDFSVRDGSLVLDDMMFRTSETNFFMSGVVPLASDEQMSLTVRGTVEAAMAQAFVSGLRASGLLVVRVDIGGTLAVPRITGAVEIQNASARFETFPQTISGIFGTILLRGNRVEIDSLRAQLGGGQIVAGGFVTHQGFTPGRMRLTAIGTDVTLRYFEGVTVDGDFDLALSGDSEGMVLRGTYLVDQGIYYKDLDLASTIVDRLITRQAVTPRVSAGWQDSVALAIDVTADDTLRVRNNIADVTASADLQVVGTLSSPVILGRVTLDEGGKVTFQKVDYQIVQGTISFQNPFRNDPYFDLTAEGLMKARGQDLGEVEEYELTVNLTGTLDQITPNITSDPPLGDVTLLTLLAGEIGGGQPGLGSQSLSGAGTEFLLSSVGEAIGSRILPFADSFRLESVGSDGSFSPTVTLEKQISDEVFVIVIFDTASTQNIEIIQWQASKDWVIQFTRDSEKEDNGWVINALDARFRRRYEGRW